MPYDPLHLYDVPDVLAAQIVDGETTWRGLKNLFLSPDRLSPNERDSLSDKLAGENASRAAKTVTGILTNPFVWLMFITSPVGSKAIRGGRSLFNVQSEFSSFAKKGMGFLERLVNTPLEVLRGTEGPELALNISANMERLTTAAERMAFPARKRMIDEINAMLPEARKIDTLDYRAYAEGSPQRTILEQFKVALDAHSRNLSEPNMRAVAEARENLFFRLRDPSTPDGWGNWQGLDQVQSPTGELLTAQGKRDWVEEMSRRNELEFEKWRSAIWEDPTLTKGQKASAARRENWDADFSLVQVRQDSPSIVRERTVVEHAIMDPDAASALKGKFKGLEDFHRSNVEVRKYVLTQMLGDEAVMAANPGTWVTDPAKLRRLANAMSRTAGTGERGAISLQGQEILASILGEDVAARVSGISRQAWDPLKKQERMGILQQLMDDEIGTNWNSEQWMPRNLVEVVTPPGRPTPLRSADDFQEQIIKGTARSRVTGRVTPITEKELMIHPEDLALYRKHGVLNAEGVAMEQMVNKRAAEKYLSGETYLAYRTDYLNSMDSYLREVSTTAAMDTAPIPRGVVYAERETIGAVDQQALGRSTRLFDRDEVVSRSLASMTEEERNGMSLGDQMERLLQKHVAPDRQSFIRETFVPAALGKNPLPKMVQYADQLRAKRWIGGFANSWLGRQMEGWGNHGQELITEMRRLADPSVTIQPGFLSAKLAGYLYQTHLGLNLSSIVVNLTQPLMLAGTIGNPGQVMRAYKAAFMEMAEYAKERAGMGAFISEERRAELIRKHFQFAGTATEGKNLLGIGPDFFDMIDEQAARSGGKFGKIGQLMMKGFEKSEWLNRNASAHLLKEVYKGAGRTIHDPHFQADLEQFVLQTQFGQGNLNTPSGFLKQPFNNPLFRQFMTFPLRSVVGALDVFPKLGESGYWEGLKNTTLRGLGMSAFVYEVGKGMLGADLSRGLFASAVTDFVGGRDLTTPGRDYLPIPPIVQIPVDLVRGVAQDDMDLFSRAVARTVPAGVSAMRLLGVGFPIHPPGVLGGDLVGAVQRTYVGWDQEQDGLVPVYRADGALIDWAPRVEVMAKGLGIDLGAWSNKGGLDGYLMKNREEIVGYRGKLLQAIVEGKMGEAQGIQQEFGRRFKDQNGKPLPLTLTKEQVTRFVDQRIQSRPERILDRIPLEARPAYQRLLAQSGVAPQLRKGALEARATAGQRVDDRPERREELVRQALERVRQVGPAAQVTAFDPFTQ